MIFAPFYVYFLYFGIRWVFDLAIKYIKIEGIKSLGKVMALSSLFFILYANFSGNSFFISITNNGYTHIPTLESFFEAGQWVNLNTPEDAIIASRKPRLFYLFSDRKGVGTTGITEVYDQSKDQAKIDRWLEQGVDYIIFDRFSSTTLENILPLFENNPKYFKLVHQTADEASAYVVQLIDPG